MNVITSAATHHCDEATASSIMVSGEALFLDEVVKDLRERLRHSQMKCDSLERERDGHIAKAHELRSMLGVCIETTTTSTNDDDDDNKNAPSQQQQQQLVQQTLQVAELTHDKEVLRSELSKSHQRIKELELDCRTNRSVLMELSQIFRSVTMSSGHHQDILHQMETMRINNNSIENCKEADSDNEDDDNDNHDGGILADEDILSPQQALDLTLSTLREQVESLEDERQRYICRIRTLQNYLEEQRRENEARELKIMALERQMDIFWTENAALKEFLDNSIDVLQANEVNVAAAVAAAVPTNDNHNDEKKRANDYDNIGMDDNAAAAAKHKKTARKFGWRRRKEVV